MLFTLSTVDADDAELLVRKCDFPAMRDNPLHLLMFPQSSKDTEEEEIKWTVEGLQDTLRRRPAGFRKVCLEDGTPVGFAGWSLEQTTPQQGTSSGNVFEVQEMDPARCARRDYWHPNTLDVQTWVEVSKIFKTEKKRVLNNRKNIWRKFSGGIPFERVSSNSCRSQYDISGSGISAPRCRFYAAPVGL